MRPVALTSRVIAAALGTLWLLAGCATPQNIVHTVSVAQDVKPLQIDAGKGDEIRWVNKGSHPISVIFNGTDVSRTSCRKGFQEIDRTMLTAVVRPNSSGSLCFTAQGKYGYQVRLNEDLAGSEMDRNASVWIVGRGERNPKPGEQFENITP